MDHIKSVAMTCAFIAVAFVATQASAMSIAPPESSDGEVWLQRNSSEPALSSALPVALTADRWTNEANPLHDRDGRDNWDWGGDHDWGHDSDHDGHRDWSWGRDHDSGHDSDHDGRAGDGSHHRWPDGGVPRPVPLPDALPLLLSGLGSLLVVARRRR